MRTDNSRPAAGTWFPRWWLRIGSWFGPGLCLVAGVTLTVESYLPPRGWDSLLTRIVGAVLLIVAPAMLLDSILQRALWKRMAQEGEVARPRLVEFREGTDAYEELRAAELAAASVDQVTVRRSALALILSGYGAMRAVLNAQVRLDQQRARETAGDE